MLRSGNTVVWVKMTKMKWKYLLSELWRHGYNNKDMVKVQDRLWSYFFKKSPLFSNLSTNLKCTADLKWTLLSIHVPVHSYFMHMHPCDTCVRWNLKLSITLIISGLSLIYMEGASCTCVNTDFYCPCRNQYQGLNSLLVGWCGYRHMIPNTLHHQLVLSTCCRWVSMDDI